MKVKLSHFFILALFTFGGGTELRAVDLADLHIAVTTKRIPINSDGTIDGPGVLVLELLKHSGIDLRSDGFARIGDHGWVKTSDGRYTAIKKREMKWLELIATTDPYGTTAAFKFMQTAEGKRKLDESNANDQKWKTERKRLARLAALEQERMAAMEEKKEQERLAAMEEKKEQERLANAKKLEQLKAAARAEGSSARGSHLRKQVRKLELDAFKEKIKGLSTKELRDMLAQEQERLAANKRRARPGFGVVPSSLEIKSGDSTTLLFKIDFKAPDEGLPIDVKTNIPNSVIMPEVMITKGSKTVNIPIRGGEPGKGKLVVTAPGYQPVDVAIRIY